jgi:predicted phosphoadenosine phosphosulfate sulfurtransferase
LQQAARALTLDRAAPVNYSGGMDTRAQPTKTPIGVDVLEAARKRIAQVYDDFPHVYVAFSGGKDSGVLVHLALEEATRRGRLPLHLLCLDLEAQYAHTVDFVRRIFDRPDVTGHWCCLPLNLRNSVSQYRPFWLAWEPDARDKWVRPMPDHPLLVKDEAFFPFFSRGMEFEDFVQPYHEWVAAQHGRTACLVGIRADESLNRYRTVKSETKTTWKGHKWTTRITDACYSAFPIYDWRTEDIWTANGRFSWDYNHVYDLMQLAGLTLSQMRLCQPYGDDQRKGLWLFRILEPETWARVVARVEGANFGRRHASDKSLGRIDVDLPNGHTWETYAAFLLATMPHALAAHYRAKISTFLRWWAKNGHPGGIPDTADLAAEAARKAPSWRRVVKVLMKNDYWCKGLSFAQTKREHDRQLARALTYLAEPK